MTSSTKAGKGWTGLPGITVGAETSIKLCGKSSIAAHLFLCQLQSSCYEGGGDKQDSLMT